MDVDMYAGLGPATPDNPIPVLLDYPTLINPNSGKTTADLIHPESTGAASSNPNPVPVRFAHVSIVIVGPIPIT
jgi:hypothetical protein